MKNFKNTLLCAFRNASQPGTYSKYNVTVICVHNNRLLQCCGP